MKLISKASSSKGNSHILLGKDEALMLDCGITDLHTTFDEQSKKRGIPIHGILGCDFLNNNNFTIKC